MVTDIFLMCSATSFGVLARGDEMYQLMLVGNRDVFSAEMECIEICGNIAGFAVAGQVFCGEEALSLLNEQHFDLVITDIRMPKMDGIALLREIKAAKLASCVALFSEYADFEYARQGIIWGAFDYLTKPLDASKIVALLDRVEKYLQQEEKQENSGTFYGAAELRNLIDVVATEGRTEQIPAIFEKYMRNIVQTIEEEEQKNGVLHRSFVSVRKALFNRYPWLRHYLQSGQVNASPGSYLSEIHNVTDLTVRLLPSNIPDILHTICLYILENPESEITLSAISERFYINHTYLSNIFRQKTTQRYNDYITLVRMERARYLLLHSDRKVYDIGGVLGYRDIDYFKRIFKKHTGKTPNEYRKCANILPPNTKEFPLLAESIKSII